MTLRRIFCVALAAAAALSGCKAYRPGKLERAAAEFVKRDVTIGGGEDHNPFPPTSDLVDLGEHEFDEHCSMCHGLDGRATGVPFADKMSPPIPNLSARGIQAYKDGQLRWIIRNGISPSGMPSWDGVLNDRQIWAIVAFIRNLPPEGSRGVPAAYKDAQ